jgi:hypothetical protein
LAGQSRYSNPFLVRLNQFYQLKAAGYETSKFRR